MQPLLLSLLLVLLSSLGTRVVIVIKLHILKNGTIRSHFHADTLTLAILNCGLKEIQFKLSNTVCLLLIIRRLLNSVASPPML